MTAWFIHIFLTTLIYNFYCIENTLNTWPDPDNLFVMIRPKTNIQINDNGAE